MEIVVVLIVALCILLAWGPRVLLACIFFGPPAVFFATLGIADLMDWQQRAKEERAARALAAFCATPAKPNDAEDLFKRFQSCGGPDPFRPASELTRRR